MKMIMSALAASVLLGGFAASARAETVSISSIMQEYAKVPGGEAAKYAKQRRILAKGDDEYIADKRETGTEGWWRQMDREQRGGRR